MERANKIYMKQHKLFWGSSYDRGLQHLLGMWDEIKEKYPDAELHICYGWNTFMDFYKDNPERLAWKRRIDEMMNKPGIIHHGRLSKEELQKVRQQCGIWAYPTHFTEINCMTALECQKDGCVPVTMNLAALSETVKSGIKVDGDIYDDEVKEEYLKRIFEMMENKGMWEEEQVYGKEFVKKFTWEKIADKWEKNFV